VKMKDKVPAELRIVAQAARSGSRGVLALFAGDSGTGKSMAAEILANYLNLDLYRISLTAVVSTHMCETEENLDRLFDAAQNGDAILFFDEADALFGKRSDGRDSHDRYANGETEYFLRRLERFPGIVVPATKEMDELDRTFLTKIPVIVEFPLRKSE
jgi:SpoVK/Ycf46/Vps4 family AAA+-type ATPase